MLNVPCKTISDLLPKVEFDTDGVFRFIPHSKGTILEYRKVQSGVEWDKSEAKILPLMYRHLLSEEEYEGKIEETTSYWRLSDFHSTRFKKSEVIQISRDIIDGLETGKSLEVKNVESQETLSSFENVCEKPFEEFSYEVVAEFDESFFNSDIHASMKDALRFCNTEHFIGNNRGLYLTPDKDKVSVASTNRHCVYYHSADNDSISFKKKQSVYLHQEVVNYLLKDKRKQKFQYLVDKSSNPTVHLIRFYDGRSFYCKAFTPVNTPFDFKDGGKKFLNTNLSVDIKIDAKEIYQWLKAYRKAADNRVGWTGISGAISRDNDGEGSLILYPEIEIDYFDSYSFKGNVTPSAKKSSVQKSFGFRLNSEYLEEAMKVAARTGDFILTVDCQKAQNLLTSTLSTFSVHNDSTNIVIAGRSNP